LQISFQVDNKPVFQSTGLFLEFKMYKVSKRVEIAGAHCLKLDYDSPCSEMHGHNWIIVVTVEGKELNQNGMLIDFKHISEVVNRLDHQYINQIVGPKINPTAENLAKWIMEEVQCKIITSGSPITTRVVEVSVQESEGNIACYSL